MLKQTQLIENIKLQLYQTLMQNEKVLTYIKETIINAMIVNLKEINDAKNTKIVYDWLMIWFKEPMKYWKSLDVNYLIDESFINYLQDTYTYSHPSFKLDDKTKFFHDFFSAINQSMKEQLQYFSIDTRNYSLNYTLNKIAVIYDLALNYQKQKINLEQLSYEILLIIIESVVFALSLAYDNLVQALNLNFIKKVLNKLFELYDDASLNYFPMLQTNELQNEILLAYLKNSSLDILKAQSLTWLNQYLQQKH